MQINSSYSHVNISSIKLDGTVGHNYQLPYFGPIEIEIRVIGNGSTSQAGKLPEIYFSEEPTQIYYSWDLGANQTELTGLPSINGQHTLDVYALDSDDVWTHERFVLTTVGVTPTTTTPPPVSFDPLLLGGIAVAGIVVVVIVVVLRRKH
jgi:hypothetical protein